MINVAILVGRLVADPELRTTPQGVSTTRFTIACNRAYVKQGAERQADFIDVVAWRQSAEFVCKYFTKGQRIAIEGSIQTHTYTDKETGKNRKVTEVIANNVRFVDAKGASSGQGGYAAPAQGGGYAAQQGYAGAEPATYASGDVDDFAMIDDSEDLPF